MFDLYLITDPDAPGGIASSVRAALRDAPRGRIAVQLRAKQLTAHAQLQLAHELRAITRDAGAALLINERVDIAQLVAADGVHLPEGSMPASAARALLGSSALIGASCHNASGLAGAADEGADFVALAPVYDVPGKASPLGITRFAELVRSARLPVYALGGVAVAQISELYAAGASGVAVIRAVFAADEPQAAVRACLAAIDAARATRS